MKSIIKSLAIIVAVAAVAGGATYAYFSSTASVTNNTYSTGTLDIQLRNANDTSHAITGFTVSNMKPGDCVEKTFAVLNYDSPHFAGTSTLDAKYLKISATNFAGDGGLFNALTIKVEANRGWPNRMLVYNTGAINGLTNKDLLSPNWTSLNAGDSEDVYYTVCLPTDGDQTALQGKSCSFQLDTEARTN